jgi:excisionase family DNA binding protein
MSREELMSTAEVAALWGCSVETVRRRIRSGALPVVRMGSVVRVRRTDALAGQQSPE